jgi:YfiH family protein
MNNDSTKINSITPDWNNFPHISAGFSLSDTIKSSAVQGSSDVSETDLGINTLTPLEITYDNRKKWLKEFGVNHDNLAFLKQVHGNEVLYVDRPGLYDGADGLITDVPDLALGILVADCAAILAVDPQNAIIGAFHAGWRGTCSGIVENGISKMRALGAKDLYVWVSPCIGVASFEVGEEVADQFPSEFVIRGGYEKPHVDLKGFIQQKLISLDIPLKQIQSDDRCTVEDEIFHSFRRQKTQSGRMMAFVSIKY